MQPGSRTPLCLTGDDVPIPGFCIHGAGTKRLLMRQGDNAVVASNDNWGDNANWQEIRNTLHRCAAPPQPCRPSP